MAATMIVAGLFIMVLADVWAMYSAFRLGLAKGTLGLILPGYVALLAKRNGFYGRTFITWVAGASLVALGTILYTLK